MAVLDNRSCQSASLFRFQLIAALLLVVLGPIPGYAQSATPLLEWDDSSSVPITGYAVTVDGVRTDYGLTPVPANGVCGCQIPAWFMNGRHTVVVSAYNANGEVSSSPLIVGPTANAGGPYAAQAGAALSVSGAASTDQTASISSYAWLWGDGTSDAALPTPGASHVYQSAGTFTITLTVTDAHGASSSVTTTASIAPAALPGAPVSPSPANGATSVATSTTLGWSASSATSYTVRFGTANPPPDVATGVTAAAYPVSGLSSGAAYYWQVVANSASGSTAGPVWSFTTAAGQAPSAPANPAPAAGATNIGPTPTLTWSGAGATSYTIRFGQQNPPPQVATGVTSATYQPAGLYAASVYYWQVIAVNAAGSSAGPIWTFSTTGAQVPSVPANPSPGPGATNVGPSVTLGWNSSGATRYTVRFGASNPPPQVATGLTTTAYSVTGLAGGTTYYWQVVATNAVGSAAGPVWSFATASQVPSAPTNPAPATGATNVGPTSLLTWSSAGATSYAIRFGTANPPPQIAVGLTTGRYPVSGLASATVYYWQVVASNAAGSTAGPVWAFTSALQPPSAPMSPAPANGSANIGLAPTLTWSSAGATSYAIRFGTVSPPPQIAAGLTISSYAVSGLASGTTYYWQVVASNGAGSTAGPVWAFTSALQSPSAPTNPGPVNGATNIGPTPALTWSSTGATSYTVRFGGVNPPPQVATGMTSPTYQPAALYAATVYYWQVVAVNAAGSSAGPVWTFSTTGAQLPATPGTPSPANGATNIGSAATLTWSSASATSYTIRFGTANPPPQVATGLTTAAYPATGLANGATYYWQVVATNAVGSMTGPVWSFATSSQLPSGPTNPAPANGATRIGPTPTLTWSSAGATSYTIRFGSSNPPPQVATGLTGASYQPSPLYSGTTYYWQVVAVNSSGSTAGPVWSFHAGS